MPEFSRLLHALAGAHQMVLELKRWVAAQPQVRTVTSGFDPREHETGARVELYVDAELITNNSVCWWLEIAEAEDEWVVYATVLITHRVGQDCLWEIEPIPVRTTEELVTAILRAVADLTSSKSAALRDALLWPG